MASTSGIAACRLFPDGKDWRHEPVRLQLLHVSRRAGHRLQRFTRRGCDKRHEYLPAGRPVCQQRRGCQCSRGRFRRRHAAGGIGLSQALGRAGIRRRGVESTMPRPSGSWIFLMTGTAAKSDRRASVLAFGRLFCEIPCWLCRGSA